MTVVAAVMFVVLVVVGAVMFVVVVVGEEVVRWRAVIQGEGG